VSAVLWHIPISHYNEKARWALDYKAIAYELRAPMPGLHRVRALTLTRGRHQRLPILDLDGRRVADSTAIIAALEEHTPEPPLYPADAGELERALALEDHFDEELAPLIRRFMWHHTLGDTDATLAAVAPNAGEARKRVMRLVAPGASRMVRRDFEIDDETAAAALDGIRSAMDRLEAELGSREYLVGDSFTVADLTAAALFTPLLAPAERPWAPKRLAPILMAVREELDARPGGRWVHEIYARHRGAPVTA
jgi:glutathione S-transferase